MTSDHGNPPSADAVVFPRTGALLHGWRRKRVSANWLTETAGLASRHLGGRDNGVGCQILLLAFSTRERTELSVRNISQGSKSVSATAVNGISRITGDLVPQFVSSEIISALARVPGYVPSYRRCETSRSNTRKVNHPAEHRQLNQNIFHHHSVIVNGTA